jgi:hypothetical protein
MRGAHIRGGGGGGKFVPQVKFSLAFSRPVSGQTQGKNFVLSSYL